MIFISGSEDTGYEATLKMGLKSEPFEIAIDYEGELEDISNSKFALKVEDTTFPMIVEDGVAKIQPSNISLATGIYPFAVFMDEKSIMQGYFEWLGDDN